MNIISYIVILSVNTGDNDKDAKLGAIIFFSISGFILLITLLILLLAYKTEYFKYYLRKSLDFNKIENIENDLYNLRLTEGSNTDEIINQKKINKNFEEEITFKQLFKQLYEIDLLACYLYIIIYNNFRFISRCCNKSKII